MRITNVYCSLVTETVSSILHIKARAFAFTLTAILLTVAALAGSASDIDNCCSVDRQCHSDRDWIDGYYAFQNNQCPAPAQSQPASNAPAQIDNCCFVDRQCSTELQWIAGYHAYQNNQCAAPAQTQTVASSQPSGAAPAQIDNCCYVDRQCSTDLEWRGGYHAYQNNQCVVPGQTQTRASFQPSGGVILRTASGAVYGRVSGHSILPSTGVATCPRSGKSFLITIAVNSIGNATATRIGRRAIRHSRMVVNARFQGRLASWAIRNSSTITRKGLTSCGPGCRTATTTCSPAWTRSKRIG